MLKKTLILVALFFGSVISVPMMDPEIQIERMAPLIAAQDAEIIPDSYIVVLKKNAPAHKIYDHHRWVRSLHSDNTALSSLLDSGMGARLRHTYDLPNLKGYAGKFSKKLLDKIRASEEVEYVEHDQMVYTTELQRNAPWGLSRLSHRSPLTLRTFNKYPYDARGGEGVTVYVIDTGINVNHSDFEGRASWGFTAPEDDGDEDGNGHGSHVAGTIAGKRFGVAKKAKVVAVKVLRGNGSGTMSDVVAGVEWAVEAHQIAEAEAKKKGEKLKGSAANMSLGGGKSQALDDAVDAAVEAGLHFAVAAGNDNRDACDYSPAASKGAITVGATTIEDERAWFSNWGKCVDIFAPGKDITSVWIGSKVATNTISGTSMASPHVAGLIAYYLSLHEGSTPLAPKLLKQKMIDLGTKNILEKIPKDTPNILIFNDPPATFYRELGIDHE